jgi:hypothetical protein
MGVAFIGQELTIGVALVYTTAGHSTVSQMRLRGLVCLEPLTEETG